MTSALEEYMQRNRAALRRSMDLQLKEVYFGITRRSPAAGQCSVADVPLRHFHKQWPIPMDVMIGPPDEVPR